MEIEEAKRVIRFNLDNIPALNDLMKDGGLDDCFEDVKRFLDGMKTVDLKGALDAINFGLDTDWYMENGMGYDFPYIDENGRMTSVQETWPDEENEPCDPFDPWNR